MKLAVFAYDFPHKKSQDFLVRLFLEGYKVEFVVAAAAVSLKLPKSGLRTKPTHVDLIHPRAICERLGIPYYLCGHNDSQVVDLLRSGAIEVGVVAGARILNTSVIRSARKGIINFHPGLIPEVRGLDALKWAIYYGLPVGVTAHFIDERVDAGRVVMREEIPLSADDTLVDISLRLAETETKLLPQVLELVKNQAKDGFPLVGDVGKANPPMPRGLEAEVTLRLQERLRRLDR